MGVNFELSTLLADIQMMRCLILKGFEKADLIKSNNGIDQV